MRSAILKPRALFISLSLPALIACGCALGEESPPGCQSSDECEPGWICKAGACFHSNTPMSPPSDSVTDAGPDT